MIEWREEQRAMLDALRKFVREKVDPHREKLESGELPPCDILRSL